jgi:hypothetical protein
VSLEQSPRVFSLKLIVLTLGIIQAVPTDGDEKSTVGPVQESKGKFHFALIMDQIRTLWLEIGANEEILTIERCLQSFEHPARLREAEYGLNMVDLLAERSA